MRIIRKLFTRLLLLVLAAAVAVCCLVGAGGYRMYRAALAQQSLQDRVAGIRAQPGYTPLDQLPQLYLDAVVAVEDRRFYQHAGIDPIAIVRAAVHDLSTGTLDQGGSTITQQVAKNLFFTQEKQFVRKAAEVFMAFALEGQLFQGRHPGTVCQHHLFRGRILRHPRCRTGVFRPAARRPDPLSVHTAGGHSQRALGVLAHRPPDLAAQRQQYVLRQMVRNGYLTQAQADAIVPS